MKIRVSNRQRRVRIDTVNLADLAHRLIARATGRSQAPAPHGLLTLVLVGDRAMRRLNRTLLGHSGTTDVISLRYDPIPGEAGTQAFAEIYLNMACACCGHPAVGRRWTADRELALYLAHGIDHLFGSDNDDTPDGAKRMRRRELGWLRHENACGLILSRPGRHPLSRLASTASDCCPAFKRVD